MPNDEQTFEGPAGLRCAEVLELMTEALEDVLAEIDALSFWAHLAGCKGCRVYLDQLRLTIRLIGEAGRLATTQSPSVPGVAD